MQVLTDAQRRVVAPLTEACRPRGKTQRHDLRRTVKGDHLPTPQQRQVADHSRVAWTLVGHGSDLHPPPEARPVGEDLLDFAQAKGVAAGISNQANGRAGIGIKQPVASGNCIIVPEARQRSQAGRTIGP
jgi:hypothetical protein